MRQETNDKIDRLLDRVEGQRKMVRIISVVMPIVALIGLVIFGALLLL